MKINEDNFVEQLKFRNEKALEYVIDNYGRIVKSIVKKHLFSLQDYQEECINDVFLAVWENIESYRPMRSSFVNWIAGIARYKAIDYKRKYLKRIQTENLEDVTAGEELAQSTNTVELDETFTLEDGTEVYLNKMTDNALGQKIYFSTSTGECDYDLVLKGFDDCGNAVEFTLSRWSDGVGRLNISTIQNGNLSDEAAELYLTPYAVKFPEQSGRLSNDFKQAGEEFTIHFR